MAIGRDAPGATIVTGSGNSFRTQNIEQRGKYNINAETFTGHIGDNYAPQSDYVAGDKIDGDKVMGNKTSVTTQEHSFQAVKHVCPAPDCDMVWVKRSVGQEAPKCSIHSMQMVAVGRS